MAFNFKQLLARGPERIRPDRVVLREIPLPELGAVVAYVLIAALWCVFADDIFDWLMERRVDSAPLQAAKGINFVLVTSLVLYFVLRRSFRNRRLAEEASRLSQERFESVALATTDAIWDWDLDTNVIWWSDGLEKLFGYKPEDVSTKIDWWLDKMHPDDKDRAVQSALRVAEGGGRTWSGQYRVRRKDGSYAVVLDRGYILKSLQGQPVRIVGGITDISERRKAEEALENSQRQLRALSARLRSTREEERAAVAREIHDELGQFLTALKLNLDWLENKIGKEKAGAESGALLDRIVESADITESALLSVQRIATELRPALLDHLGLGAALEQEARRFEQRSGISCHLQSQPELPDLSEKAATAVFRIFQEALTNIARHSQATSVRVVLTADADQLTLQIEDDGRGIGHEQINSSKSLGLLGMKERASVLGGEVSISSLSPRGTRVTLRLPRGADDTTFWSVYDAHPHR